MCDSSLHVFVNVEVIESGLQLLNVCGFSGFKAMWWDGMFNGDRDVLVVIVVFLPPSERQLCLYNGLSINLCEFTFAAGLTVREVIVTAFYIHKCFPKLRGGDSDIANARCVEKMERVSFGCQIDPTKKAL